MDPRHRIVLASCAFLCLMSMVTHADDHTFVPGIVVNVAKVRTEDGKFAEYMKYLDTTWKQYNEAAKKAGYILGYQVLKVEPRGPDDPDVLLVTTYKDWNGVDWWITKGEVIAKQIEGSSVAASASQGDRSKIRRNLGSMTMQVLDLK